MNFTIHDLHAQLVNKEISAVELTKKVIAHRDSVEKDVHAYLSLSDAKALEKAAEVDAKIAAGEEISDLAGIPGAIKDNICISGETCTAASRMLEHWVAPMMPLSLKNLSSRISSLSERRTWMNSQWALLQKIPLSDRQGTHGIWIMSLAAPPAALLQQ